MSSKIVVVGDVKGQFSTVFEKISALHAKNNFTLALIGGDLFADPSSPTADDTSNVSALIEGHISVPLPTYFALGRHPFPAAAVDRLNKSDDGELCENLYFLGKCTTIKTAEGVRIVALGGVLDQDGDSGGKYSPFYTEDDCRTLGRGGAGPVTAGANGAEILITCDWPAGIRSGSRATYSSDSSPLEQTCVANVCAAVKPRYHFSTSAAFWEREPYFHIPSAEDDDASKLYPITRFISLAPFGNANKQKWIYAFTVDPSAPAPLVVPQGVTISPLSISTKKRAALPTQNEQYRFTAGAESHHLGHRHNKRQKKRHDKQPPPGPSECFFCLSNPNLATHLLASIGSEAYLAAAKGPLPMNTTYTSLAPSFDFPAHVLIIPLSHVPTLSALPNAESRNAVQEEMLHYRWALQQMLVEKGCGKLGAVAWEVSRERGIHAHWQWMPVEAGMVTKGLVEAAFKVEAENEGWNSSWERHAGPGKTADEKSQGDFFRLWIWSPPQTPGNMAGGGTPNNDAEYGENLDEDITSLTLPLNSSFRFDLQFGRRVMAKLLGLETRLDWRACAQSQDEEATDVEAFKKAFEAFDFTLRE
ncbi:CwfJ domain-containing protein [Lineolata rhizophorae]|uniref:CwfJ domain-containing protein n=1 Tax=Lineolata rhizophorae TaxID=578093 RepID=A0A6A6P1J4_9PEZI|nr:CwfJ domain-containing protein [Lineolata rhizophorae]